MTAVKDRADSRAGTAPTIVIGVICDLHALSDFLPLSITLAFQVLSLISSSVLRYSLLIISLIMESASSESPSQSPPIDTSNNSSRCTRDDEELSEADDQEGSHSRDGSDEEPEEGLDVKFFSIPSLLLRK